jgi:hypothetical protein
VKADVVTEWPKDQALLDAVSTVVFTGDTFPLGRMPEAPANLASLGAMMKRGCGIVCVHYATGLRAEDVADDGAHPLLGWLGGYFATKCKHHQSIAKIYAAATITPAAAGHSVSRGWKEFTLNDEPYINNFFGGEGNALLPGVTVLATSMLPPESPKSERVAWCVERADGGRGFGIVMPHFYRNWKNEDLRRFILNGIVWTAKLDVPADGVKTAAPDLASFAPASVEPLPPKQKPVAGADTAADLAKKIVAAHGGPVGDPAAEPLVRRQARTRVFREQGRRVPRRVDVDARAAHRSEHQARAAARRDHRGKGGARAEGGRQHRACDECFLRRGDVRPAED